MTQAQRQAVQELPPTPTASPELIAALDSWRARLGAAGVICRATALASQTPQWNLDFADTHAAVSSTWQSLRTRVSAEQPVVLSKLDAAHSQELMVATSIQLPHGEQAVVGALIAPPHNERVIQLVLLSLGWLQLAVAASSLTQNRHAARLLEVLGHVGSQRNARTAAQEWINRTAAWAREQAGTAAIGLGLTLFRIDRSTAHWWITADTASVEKGSSATHETHDLASRVMIDGNEVQDAHGWAMPLFNEGRICAVLVLQHRASRDPLPSEAIKVLRTNANLSEPLLRQWHIAERGIWPHAMSAIRGAYARLFGDGHLVWKVGACGVTALLLVLFVWPVPDRVDANAVIEGRVRQVVTAPFDGFIAQALVRPGAQIRRGETLIQLDDRDLKLEQHKHASERGQAAAKLRQAMAEHDAPALAVASADLQQAEAGLALVDTKLARATLTAPLDGLVVSGDWAQQVGAPVETGKELFEIASTDGFRVVLQVQDRDITRVHAGQRGTLRLTAQPQTAYVFEVTRVTATAAVQDGANSFRVEAAWHGEAPVLSPGMQGIGKVEVGQANLFTVWTRSSINWLRLKLWSWWW